MASTDTVTAADVQITGTLDMRQFRVTGLNTNTAEYPAQPSDGATKKYVDEQRDQIVANLPTAVDNGNF